MKKKLFGMLLLSVILSSMAYAESEIDIDELKERREAFKKMRMQEKEEQIEKVTNLNSEEEKEAYEALERARARIKKEEKEKLQAQQEAEKEVEKNIVEEQVPIENSNMAPTESVVLEPRMSPEEEKEAYEALERVRARIKKEDEERAKALQMLGEQVQ